MTESNWGAQYENRLEIEHRGRLHIEINRQLNGGSEPDPDEFYRLSEIVSELIDHEDHAEVRELARVGKYKEAVDILLPLIRAELKKKMPHAA